MKFTKTRKVVAMLLLFALLFSTFPISAVANDTGQAAETAETEANAVTETTMEPPIDGTEANGADPESALIETESETDDNGEAVLGLEPDADVRASHGYYMRLLARVFFNNGGPNLDNIKRMVKDDGSETLYTVYCLRRNKSSAYSLEFDYDQSNWYIGSYAQAKKEAIGKIVAIAKDLDYNVGYPYLTDGNTVQTLEVANLFVKELAVQFLIWEITEKTTDGPYLLSNTFRYKLNDINYIAFINPYGGSFGNTYTASQGLDIDGALAYYDNIAREFNKTINPPALPSFAGPTADSIAPYEMTYNSASGKYTLTMQDTNNVLSHYTPSCSNSNVTVTTSGNTITVTATNPDAFNNATISLKSDTYSYTFNANDFFAFIPDDRDTYQTCLGYTNPSISYQYGYFKIKAETKKPVTIKKETDTTGGSNVAACIQGNNMYSLAGAQFKITASGYSDKIVTTGADGTVVINDTYKVNTVITVQEIKAPPGYILDSEPKQFTVTADGNNVFVMKDKPVFDPNQLVLTKTGNNNERIAGAVFKVEYFDNDNHSGTPLRTWYFESKSNGLVQFTDDYLASGYTSSDLFKPDGVNVVFPLGSVKVTEIKAAPNYILPSGSAATAYIYIEQSQDTLSAKARWGDSNGNTVTTLGIYQFTNDGVNAVNQELYGAPPTLKKVDPSNVSLEGAVFEVTYYNAAYSSAATDIRTWYFKTNANGTFELKNSYLASGYTSTGALFPVDKIPLGLMRIKEVEAPAGFETSDTVAFWRMKQNGNTDKSYWVESDGYTETTSYGDDVYVPSGSSNGELYFGNEPIPGTMTMRKTLPDNTPGGLEGFCFNIYRRPDTSAGETHGVLWYGRTDANGNIYQTNSSHEAVAEGSRDYIFEGLYDGLYDFRELLSMREYKNTKTTKVTFTVTDKNGAQAMQWTYSDSSLSWQDNGDCTISKVHLTGLNGGGRLSITIQNEPIPVGSITVKKVDESGRPMPGVTFLLEYSVDSSAWFPVTRREETSSITPGGCTSVGLTDGKLITGSDGPAVFTGLCSETDSGPVLYRLTETATKPGYGLLAGPAYEGPLPEGETHDVTLTAVNMPEFQMPMTGGRGFTGTAVSTLVALTAAAALVCLLRKKR